MFANFELRWLIKAVLKLRKENQIMKKVKIAVTGAAGQIGYALLFRIASGAMFGRETQVELNLLEVPAALPALCGVVMELEDGAFPLLRKINTFSDPVQAFGDIDWAILVGSVPRKAGMERSELLKINGGIFIEQGKALDASARKDCKVLVVGNPCNTNAYIAKQTVKKLAPEQFFAMTMLDQNRAVAQLAKKAGVGIAEVKRLAVWGNHSATQYPDFYNAQISGRPAAEVIADEKWLQTEFLSTVQQRGAAIIKARGLSSAASAANAIVDTVVCLTTPTPENDFFSVAVSADGSYGIEEGLMFSFPVRSDGKKWKIVGGISQESFGQQKIAETKKELIEERDSVRKLL